MFAKYSKFRALVHEFSTLFWVSGAFAVWVLLCQFNWSAGQALVKSKANLRLGTNLVTLFKKQYGEVPASIAELKAFAAITGTKFQSYDAYNNALEYLRLTTDHFILRSFGPEGEANSLTSDPGLVVGNWGEVPQEAAKYRYQELLRPHVYPSLLALGSFSANGDFFAQLYHDPAAGVRRLVVRSRNGKNLEIAPHDFVEEFLWLPDSEHLLFSATSSSRYEDGLYLWQLKSGNIVNLIGRANNPIHGDTSIRAYYIALAGASLTENSALAFIAPRISPELNPVEFYARSTLYKVVLPLNDNGGAQLISGSKHAHREVLTHLNALEHLAAEINHHPVYAAFAKLSFEGDIEPVISNWQLFATDYGNSVIVPYCLWLLSAIYNDAYQVFARYPTKNDAAVTMRSYGAELANALAQMPDAPSYIRAFGAFNLRYLNEALPLPYTISKLRAAAAVAPSQSKRR